MKNGRRSTSFRSKRSRSDVTGFRYLLDTNIVSDLVREPAGIVTKRIARVGESMVCTSIVVACEVRYGAAKKGFERLTDQLEEVVGALPSVPLEANAGLANGS